jgi:excisionase family DNA binding protein
MKKPEEEVVTGDEIEPDESRTPVQFAREEWLTVDQAARHFGVPTVRVRAWIAAGMLTPELHGSIERIKRSELHKIGNPDDDAAKEFEKDHEP